MDLDAPRPRRVLDGDMYGATWSPDGEAIATARLAGPDAPADYRLWAVDPEGAWDQELLGDGLVNSPTWGAPPTARRLVHRCGR
jgi:hypothetical protein